MFALGVEKIEIGSRWTFGAFAWTIKAWDEEWVTFSHPLVEDWKLATGQFLEAIDTGLLERFEA